MPDAAPETWPLEGWGWPHSTKAHYFVGGLSLCSRYGFYQDSLEPDNGPSPDDCKACRKALTRRQALVQEGEQG